MSDRVLVSMEGGVADVRLNRAEKLNALDGEMFAALVATGRALAQDPSLRCAVLSGEGRAFCAGLDFGGFQSMANRENREEGGTVRRLVDRDGSSPANFAQQAAWVWAELPVPVIAALHGVVFGGGLQIALGADIRFVAPDARLSIMEIKWGLVPDMSGTQTLRRLARLDVVKELAFTGRELSGTEAVELGLATHTSETPHEAALGLAKEIAGKSPDAVRAAKRLLNSSGLVSLEEGLRLEEKLQVSLIGGPNQVEAVKANLERREPRFRDPKE